MDEDSGKRKKRRHCPNPDSLKFDKQGLLAEVKDLPENSEVCFKMFSFNCYYHYLNYHFYKCFSLKSYLATDFTIHE